MLANDAVLAEAVLKDIEGILQQLSRYQNLSGEQRLALHSRAGLARKKIDDVVKVLRKVSKEVGSQPNGADNAALD